MASNKTYRYGIVARVCLPTSGASFAIEDGDLCYFSTYAKAASALADQGAAADNRAAFAAAFAGVALKKIGLQSGETSFKLTTDPGYVDVAVTGVFEYPCAATSWAPGDLVGIYAPTDNSKIVDSQKVAKVTTYAEAIGVAIVPHQAIGTSQTTILVALRSPLVHDGIMSGQ